MFTLDVFEPNVPLGQLRWVAALALIIAGGRDVITPAHMLAIYRHLPRAWLWIVPSSGHATLPEHAAEFNQQGDAFFRACAILAWPHEQPGHYGQWAASTVRT